MHTRDQEAKRKRAQARASWPGTVRRLEDLPDVELVDGSPEELVGLVRTLTLAAWAMTGRPLPDYARSEAPGRVIRPNAGTSEADR